MFALVQELWRLACRWSLDFRLKHELQARSTMGGGAVQSGVGYLVVAAARQVLGWSAVCRSAGLLLLQVRAVVISLMHKMFD